MDSNTNTPLRLITPKANIGFLTQSDAPDFLLDLGDPALDLLTDFRSDSRHLGTGHHANR